MPSPDKACTIVPYFKVAPGQLEAFKALAEHCVEQTRAEEKCLFYGFSYSGEEAHCREGYADAAAALEHLEKIGPLLSQVLEISQLTRLEIHGPEEELARLREPLAKLNPQFFTLECGFRR